MCLCTRTELEHLKASQTPYEPPSRVPAFWCCNLSCAQLVAKRWEACPVVHDVHFVAAVPQIALDVAIDL